MRQLIRLVILAIPALFSQCGINRQVQQAKVLSKSSFAVRSADSITVAGYPIQEFKDIRQLEDINPLKYPRVAAGLLTRNVPFRANINLEIINPTNDIAAINEFDYRLLLAGNELANGTLQQRVEVAPGGGKVVVPIPVNTNAYNLLTNASTRNAFVDLARNLTGSNQTNPSRITLKIKPTVLLGNKQVKYPGYIDIDKDITSDLTVKP